MSFNMGNTGFSSVENARIKLQRAYNERFKTEVEAYKRELWKKMHFSSEKLELLSKKDWLYSNGKYMLDLREKMKNKPNTEQKSTTQFRRNKAIISGTTSISQTYFVDDEVRKAAREAAGDIVL